MGSIRNSKRQETCAIYSAHLFSDCLALWSFLPPPPQAICAYLVHKCPCLWVISLMSKNLAPAGAHEHSSCSINICLSMLHLFYPVLPVSFSALSMVAWAIGSPPENLGAVECTGVLELDRTASGCHGLMCDLRQGTQALNLRVLLWEVRAVTPTISGDMGPREGCAQAQGAHGAEPGTR